MIYSLEVRDAYPVTTFFYIEDKTKIGFLIDPGAQPEVILDFIDKNGLKMEKILLTHGHMDHIGAVNSLVEKLGIPVYIHQDDEIYLKDPHYNLSENFDEDITIENSSFIADKERIELESNSEFYLNVIHAPGHTPGSVIFYNDKDKVAFIGDVLFEHGRGLTHFPGGDAALLEETLQQKIFSLPEETVLYASHATPLTLREQKNILDKKV